MTVQDDKAAGHDDERKPTEADEEQATKQATKQAKEQPTDQSDQSDHDDQTDQGDQGGPGRETPTEKPEPDEDDKKAAAEMMEAYKDKATIVLPGSAGMVSGTAVNEWLDDEGNPEFEVPDDADSDQKAKSEEFQNDEEKKQQIEKDKELNEKLKEAASAENKGEKD